MTTSIQAVGDKHEILNDMDLLVFLGFLVEEINEHREQYPALADLRSSWKATREASGPGTIDLALDRVAADPSRLAQFDRVLSAVQKRLGAFGVQIPRELLNQRYSAPGVRFNDFQVIRLRNLVARLRRLLDPRQS